ncbi:MAG: hypothetical protein K1X83_06900 [Oligoflexia bacterium]|nr:hypothetical protein [Oligoflexia bacterium]
MASLLLRYDSAWACPLSAGPDAAVESVPSFAPHWIPDSVAVIPLEFSDAEGVYDLQQLRRLFGTDSANNSITGLFLSSSHGRLRLNTDLNGDLTPDVFEAITVKLSRSDPFDLQNWQNRAEAAALSQDLQLTPYQHLLFIVPRDSLLPMAGVTDGGCTNQMRCVSFISAANYLEPDVIVHELGHQLGIGHATDPIYGEYGDRSCPMGSAFVGWRHFNAPHQVQQGWLPTAAIQEVHNSGRFRIEALERQSGTSSFPQVLKIPHPLFSSPLYISYRAPADRYSIDLEEAYAWKVSVHTTLPRNYTALLSRLDLGQEFIESERGVRIRVVSRNKRSAEIEIEMEAPPLCDIQPVRIDSWHWPGAYGTNQTATPVEFSVTLHNQDRYCASSSAYRADFALPDGWRVMRSFPDMTLSLGSFAQGTAAVLPPAEITDGRYSIGFDFDDSNQDPFVHPRVSTAIQIWVDRIAPEQVAAIESFIGRSGSYVEINLEWDRPADSGSGVYYYEIFRDGELIAELSNSEDRPGFAEEFPEGRDHVEYRIVARDLAGNRSAASEIVQIVRPN